MTNGEDDSEKRVVPEQRNTTQPMLVRYLDLENDAWDGMRRVALGAAGAGLAISFLVLQIKDSGFDGDVYLWFPRGTLLFHFAVFPWLWTALLATMLLGLVSYGIRAIAARRAVRRVRLESTLVAPAPPLPKVIVAERAFIATAGFTVFLAFVLIVLAGIVQQ